MSLSLGIDFGTESARALLVRTEDGAEIESAVFEYPHGVLDTALPDGDVELGPGWALQHPQDYLDALETVVPAVLEGAGVQPADVIGIGVDFTSCTMLPVDEHGVPLCLHERWRRNPHSWVKLWKHHAAQQEADTLNDELPKSLLERYGGRISAEWLYPKMLETRRHAPDVYDATHSFVEAADWIVWQLTGERVRSECTAGYKAFWSREDGYAEVSGLAAEKLEGHVLPMGGRAGLLSKDSSALTGLPEGTPVAVPAIDAHASVPGAGVSEPNRLVMIVGTSICHLLMSEAFRPVRGIAGAVRDGIMPGMCGYEAGQPSMGDSLAWCSRLFGADFEELEREASKTEPGRSGVLSLDWWNGNRSVLDDSELSGLMLGLTLRTRPPDVYRALMEGSAFGTKVILDAYESDGLRIDDLVACGGIPERSPLLMQIYADITGRSLRLARSRYTSALGAAIYGAVAGGAYTSVRSAVSRMAHLQPTKYEPIEEHRDVYARLYAEYRRLYDYFGRGENPVMRVLHRMRHK